MKCIIVDIDGTLSNCDHRLHLIVDQSKTHPSISTFKPDYDWFNKESQFDKPYKDVLELISHYPHKVILMTGRSDKWAEITNDWLQENNIRYDALFMRTEGDRRSDYKVKKEMYFDHIDRTHKVDFVLEDRDRVVKMWRDIGLTCLQVKKGDY